eukprot:gene7317-7387_t
MIGLKEGVGWNPVPATLVGFLGGALVSYILNRRHTFSASSRSHGAAFWRFFMVASVGFGLTLLLGLLLMGRLQVPYILAQAVTTSIVLMWNFLANRFWTFLVIGESRLTRPALLDFARDFDPQDFHLDDAIADKSMLKGLSASGWQSCALQHKIITTTLAAQNISASCHHISEVCWLQPLRPERVLRVEARLATEQRTRHDIATLALDFVDDTDTVIMRQIADWSRIPLVPQPQIAQHVEQTESALAFEDVRLNAPQRLGSHQFSSAAIQSFNQRYDALAAASASAWHIGSCWMRAMIDHRHAEAQKLRAMGKYVPEFGPSPGIQNVLWLETVHAGDNLTFYSTAIARRG